MLQIISYNKTIQKDNTTCNFIFSEIRLLHIIEFENSHR